MASEWVEVAPGVIQRSLRGIEITLNQIEYHHQGNFELSMQVHFVVGLPNEHEVVLKRMCAAWFLARQDEPVVGIDLVSDDNKLDKATFKCLQTIEEARDWMSDTLLVVDDGRSVMDVQAATVARPIPSRGRKPIMHIVLKPKINAMGIVYNCPHVLSGHHAIFVLEQFVQHLCDDRSELGLEHVFFPEKPGPLIPKLPRSCVKAYEETFKPTEEDIDNGMEHQQNAMSRWNNKSIGVPVHPKWAERPSRCHNILFSLSEAEAKVARKAMKTLDLNMTTGFFACITSAIAQLYSKGDEDGAHCLFSAHGQRWFECFGRDGKAPVTMAIVPGGAWIDAKEVNLKASDKEGLAILGKALAWEMIQDVDCPHVIGAIDRMTDMIKNSTEAPERPVPTIARPTLTSQGALIASTIKQGPQGTKIYPIDGGYAGRNADPSICFASLDFRGQFRFHVLFDEQYFDYAEVMMLSQKVSGLFRSLYEDQMPATLATGAAHKNLDGAIGKPITMPVEQSRL